MTNKLLPWQQSVLDDQEAIAEKLAKLFEFIKSDKFYDLHQDEKVLLNCQYDAMQEYNLILIERIKMFSN